MKNDILDYLISNVYDKKLEFKFKFSIIYKNIIYFTIYFILFILSIIFNKKIYLFSSIFDNFKYVILFFYFVSFLISLELIGYLLFYIFKTFKNDLNWKINAYKKSKKLDIVTFIFMSLSMLLFFVTFIITPCSISGDSMNDTYKNNDKILCNHIYINIDKNDIVIFDASKYTNQNKMEFFVKRVVATQGDIIKFDLNEFYVNDIYICELKDYQFLNIIGSNDKDLLDNDFIIPNDMIVVFGDNIDNSYDSRSFGMINKEEVFGKVLFPKENN